MFARDEATPAPEGDAWSNDAEIPLPEAKDILFPGFYYIALMPRQAPNKIGSIYLSDMTKFSEQWLNYVGQVIAVGPHAYKGKKWRELGVTDPDTDPNVPKRGEFWCYRPNSPYRLQHNGLKFILLFDDSLMGKLPDGCHPWEYRSGV